MLRNVNLTVLLFDQEAGHSGRARPGPIPNPEVKPVVAAVLLTYVSGREAAVLALDYFDEGRQAFMLMRSAPLL